MNVLSFIKKNRSARYGNQMAKVTIMPTLNCNFRCWYCYEEHFNSKMDEKSVEATIKFCKKLIDMGSVKVFNLDWFGGEPLLYFDEIIYPIASILREYCMQKEVIFVHGITTNGYLISDERIKKFQEIDLRNFQITLDGSMEYHNKTRFSATDKNTYVTITRNIERLVTLIKNISMMVRINYTPANLPTMEKIADSFNPSIRSKIKIMPQIVWQYKNKINAVDDTIREKLKIFSNKGYNAERVYLSPSNGTCCYTENMLQFVINYDRSVYKCTARDFKNRKYSIGEINEFGEFIANNVYYNYFVASSFENNQCLSCEYLPSCGGMCIQKKIEEGIFNCPKEELTISLINQIKLVIEKANTD